MKSINLGVSGGVHPEPSVPGIVPDPAVNQEFIAAQSYYSRGWRVMRLPYKSKASDQKNWQHSGVAEKDLSVIFGSVCNVGVLLGGSDLCDVDVDSPHAGNFLSWLPPTQTVWGRQSNLHSHHLYKGKRNTRQYKNSQGVIVEIRSSGCYAVMPPSVHPDGEQYVWESQGDPGPSEHLEQAVQKIAIAATLLPAWKAGARHALALAVAGLLLKAGWGTESVKELVGRVAVVAGDPEVADRKHAVQTTADNLAKGKSVAGSSKLADVLGKQDACTIADWVQAESLDLGELAGCAKSVPEKRRVAVAVREDLASRGVFYRANGAADLYFFHRKERELYGIKSIQFRAFCSDLYGINGKEPVWGFIEEHLCTHIVRYGTQTELFHFARYQDHKLYVHGGGQHVFRLDGDQIDTIDNGDDGILFLSDHSPALIKPDWQFKGSPVRDHLVNVANAMDADRLALYQIYIYSLFFESLLPTKPIVLFTGPKGSGKTSAGRALKRVFLGPTANVDTGMTSKEDAFWAAICHSSLVCMDNVDALVPWLADALAVVATGSTFKRRKLYETNELVEYVPRCFAMITSRNPESFKRDDVVDRLLLIEVERRKDFVEEGQLMAQLDAARAQIWGELLLNLNKMIKVLKQPDTPAPLPHRLADWARLAIRVAPVLGIKDIQSKLIAMEKSKVHFALDDEPLVQALDEWIAMNPEHDFIPSGDLYQAITQLYSTKGQLFPIKTSRIFGTQLKNLRNELQTRYKIEDKPGTSNKKLFRFRKLPIGVSNETQPATKELESQL